MSITFFNIVISVEIACFDINYIAMLSGNRTAVYRVAVCILNKALRIFIAKIRFVLSVAVFQRFAVIKVIFEVSCIGFMIPITGAATAVNIRTVT